METIARDRRAWITAALAGFVAPALALLILPAGTATAPILAAGLMGAGMITAAASARFAVGVALALAAGAASSLILAALSPPLALAVLAASLSFAARGTLFARSAGDRGWWIALGVLAGEGAMLAVAAVDPGAVPGWLLALLPAQWASLAVTAALAGLVSPAALAALVGTAASTMLVARLWPARWPYVVMFGGWLGCAALVWHAGAITL